MAARELWTPALVLLVSLATLECCEGGSRDTQCHTVWLWDWRQRVSQLALAPHFKQP